MRRARFKFMLTTRNCFVAMALPAGNPVVEHTLMSDTSAWNFSIKVSERREIGKVKFKKIFSPRYQMATIFPIFVHLFSNNASQLRDHLTFGLDGFERSPLSWIAGAEIISADKADQQHIHLVQKIIDYQIPIPISTMLFQKPWPTTSQWFYSSQ